MRFAKHIHVLQLLSTVPDYAVEKITVQQASDCWDHLYTYIHANWAPPVSAMVDGRQEWESFADTKRNEIIDCRNMMKMSYEELEEKLQTLPPYFLEHIFPVAVARYLLAAIGGKCIPLDHRRTTTYGEFHNRYGYMVLGTI